MITAKDCFKKYGNPKDSKNFMVMWDVPAELEIGMIPKKLYCNKDIIPHLEQAFKNLIDRGCIVELKTFDGCFNIRVVRGYEKKYEEMIAAGDLAGASELLSLHSWAIAIDVNAFENGLGIVPKLSAEFVKCFTDVGFEWGGSWKRLDGMHFQLKTLKI